VSVTKIIPFYRSLQAEIHKAGDTTICSVENYQ